MSTNVFYLFICSFCHRRGAEIPDGNRDSVRGFGPPMRAMECVDTNGTRHTRYFCYGCEARAAEWWVAREEPRDGFWDAQPVPERAATSDVLEMELGPRHDGHDIFAIVFNEEADYSTYLRSVAALEDSNIRAFSHGCLGNTHLPIEQWGGLGHFPRRCGSNAHASALQPARTEDEERELLERMIASLPPEEDEDSDD